MEEGNYSECPCRQGNDLQIRKLTFEVDINLKKSSYTSEILYSWGKFPRGLLMDLDLAEDREGNINNPGSWGVI